MATDMDQAYRDWSRDELSNQSDSQETSVSQFVDSGSISFGRFASESLEWEKWSVFANNRRQEELDKFKAPPGLVAQKKAYFEEYYKKIRALKALQQSQQVDPGLDTGGNSGVCSQSGEEQTTSHVENALEETIEKTQSEEKVGGVTVEQESKSRDDPQLECLETKSVVSYPNSSRRTSNGRTEEIRQLENECNNLSDEIITKVDDCSDESTGEIRQQVNNCNGHRDEGIMRKAGGSISAFKPEADAERTTSTKAASKLKVSRVTPANGFIHKKVDLNNKECKVQLSVHKAKETVTDSLRNDVKLSHQSKANASLSAQGLKYPLHRAAGKAENACSSRNSIIQRASSNRNQTSASNRTRVEVRSNVHRPDTLPTARRANVPASTRDSALRHSNSKAMNSNERLLVQPNGRSNIQNISTEATIPRDMKNTASRDRRSHEVVSKSMVLASLHTTPRGRDPVVTRLKPISSKLPVRNKSNQSDGLQFGLRHDDKLEKQNEGKEQKVPRKPTRSLKSGIFTPASSLKTRVLKPEHNKKILSSRSVDLTRIAGKSRQEIPHWR